MHCVYLADIAAIVAEHGQSILHRGKEIPSDAMTRYWVASRNRFELWHQAMARYRRAEESGQSDQVRHWWSEHLVMMEEILVSQMLTRVVATLGDHLDAAHANDELSPITHTVHLSHMDASNRVHRLMLQGRGASVPEVVKLNRLRTGVERWTDSLLGQMSRLTPEKIIYAIDFERAKTYAEESRDCGNGESRRTVSWLMNASMRDMLTRRASDRSALPEANRAIASSVASMLRPDLFDSVGVLRSLWLNRLQIDHEITDRSEEEFLTAGSEQEEIAKGLESSKDSVFQRWYT